MAPEVNLHCWEIKNCKDSENCPARQQPEKPCWDIAKELGDYRSAFNICQDCIVFVLKNGSIPLSEKEILSIKHREVDGEFF